MACVTHGGNIMSSKQKGTALITGASSGIGAVYADRLAKRGYDLILIARSGDRLEAVAERIRSKTGQKVTTLAADLTDSAGIAKVEAILQSDASITTLVNNAGYGATAPLLKSDVGTMIGMIDINVTALTRLTYAAVPHLVERGNGTIVNIGSIAAIAPEMLNGVYAAAKAFVLTFSQSLNHELADKGVRIQVVLPGATDTDFWNVAGTPVQYLPKGIVMPVETMVDAALVGLDKGEFVTIPSLPDQGDWDRYEAARKAMNGKLSATAPAGRYALSLSAA
jgi:short-subunit dehydrogenase